MKLLSPQLDVIFKLLFTRNQHLLIAMLEAILNERIAGLEVLNPNISGDVSIEKSIALDILVGLEDGRRVDVEMQMRVTKELPPRLVYYGAREYSSQLRRGEPYDALCPTIVVAWLAQPLFDDLHQFHSVFELRERDSHRLFSKDLAIHILQLPRIPSEPPSSEAENERMVRLWARFFSAKSELEFAVLTAQNEEKGAAMEALKKISSDPEAQFLAERREDALKLYDISLRAGRDEARREGRQEGLEEGRREALRGSIVSLCAAFKLELTPGRCEQLHLPTTDLQTLFDAIAVNRTWPE